MEMFKGISLFVLGTIALLSAIFLPAILCSVSPPHPWLALFSFVVSTTLGFGLLYWSAKYAPPAIHY